MSTPGRLRVAISIAVSLLTAACSEDVSPEEEVRAVIVAAEEAAEARSVRDLMALAAPGFAGPDGTSVDELERYLRGYFIANQSVRLLTRVTHLEMLAADVAEAEVTVAAVGKDAEATAAWDLAFDVYDFDLDLRRIDGEWRVIHADWRRPGAIGR